MIKTVLFDLDGTLVDTAPDMAAALDQLCREQDQILLPFERVRPVVSNGSVALVELAFGNELEKEHLAYLKQRYLDIYAGKIAVHSKLFDGTRSVLDHLSREGMNWGVVTNKPAWLTEPLMEALGLKQLATCIVSGDTTAYSKPHPAPMFHACKLAGSTAAECIYVGDARRDIEAGNNAGMKTLIALYGYIGEDEDPRDWKASHAISKPEEILQYLTAS